MEGVRNNTDYWTNSTYQSNSVASDTNIVNTSIFISNERYGTIWMNKIREQQPSRSLGLAFQENDCAIGNEDRVAGCNLRGVVG